MFIVSEAEWNRIVQAHPGGVSRNVNEQKRDGKVSKKGAWSCDRQLLAPNTVGSEKMYEGIDFKIVADSKAPFRSVTKIWDDGHVDMTVTRLLAGEGANGWRSIEGNGYVEYTDVFPKKRDLTEYKRHCLAESRGRFKCVENF